MRQWRTWKPPYYLRPGLEYLWSICPLVPVITSGGIEEDHLDLQVMLGERFPCSE